MPLDNKTICIYNCNYSFEWDENKRLSNLEKHKSNLKKNFFLIKFLFFFWGGKKKNDSVIWKNITSIFLMRMNCGIHPCSLRTTKEKPILDRLRIMKKISRTKNKMA